ncbi:MAG: thermonuclease family protein [Myxococcota bacterium]
MIWLLACAGGDPADAGDPAAGDDTGDADTTDPLADDDARVRALTGLPEGDSPCAEPRLVRVEYTVDGDTFEANPDDGGYDFRVRIIGVDTPEIEHEDPAECYGDEAWAWTADLLEGKLVWLTFDAECEDDYDRTLAYVFRDATDEGFVNRALARNGLAYEMTIRPNDTYADEIEADIDAARDESLGLWGACQR